MIKMLNLKDNYKKVRKIIYYVLLLCLAFFFVLPNMFDINHSSELYEIFFIFFSLIVMIFLSIEGYFLIFNNTNIKSFANSTFILFLILFYSLPSFLASIFFNVLGLIAFSGGDLVYLNESNAFIFRLYQLFLLYLTIIVIIEIYRRISNKIKK
jgi:hypothetical protein